MSDKITVEGFVHEIKTKEGSNSRGPWTAYRIRLQRASGEMEPRTFGFGFTAPKFKAGDFLRFDATVKDDKWADYIEGSGKLVKNAPAKPAAPAAPSGNGGGRPGGGKGGYQQRPPVESKLFGKIGQNSTEDDIRRISYTSARTAALEMVGLLLANNALPMSSAKTKDGEAKRFTELTAAVDKLTIEYYFDSATGRKLETVADPGSKETRVAPLPEAEQTETEDEDLPEDPDQDGGEESLEDDGDTDI